jgi:PAS domain S-box-containing protein
MQFMNTPEKIGIPDQLEMEQAAQHRAAVVESSADAIITKTLEGTITSWNRAAEQIFGYRAAEVIGQPITILFPPDHINEEAEIIRRIINGEQINHYETIRRHKDGSLIPISLTVSPIKDRSGRIVGASKIARDITAQKEHEQKLISQANELEQFAYVASHDLKEPLRKVAVYTDLLISACQGKGGPEADKYAAFISDGIKRMHTLINDLLTYSRSNRDDFRFDVVDLNNAIQDVMSDLEIAIKEANVQITYQTLPTVTISRFQIHQLLQNLISNAIKFRGADPKIEIYSRQAGGEIIVAVKDNGIGIDPKYKEQIFRVFQRLHTGKKYPGTGIGLAICKKIVEHNGGKIWVESKPGEGATFFFSLPERRNEPPD